MHTQPSVVAEPYVAPAPVDSDQRIHSLDILRGLALFGMILVHFHQKMRVESKGLEDLIGWFVYVFVEQKAWGTFAFLFGVGFAVLLRRLETRGDPVVSIYLRRLGALALFGLVADVFFGFRILFDYAYWGVALLFVRRLSTRKLLIVATVSACAVALVMEGYAINSWITGSPPRAPNPVAVSLRQAVNEAARGSSYAALVAARWGTFVYALPHSWRALIPNVNLALFVLGMLALRHGLIEDPRRHLHVIRGWMTFGALSWMASWLITFFVEPRFPKLPVPGMDWPLLRGFGLVQDQWLCLTYIGAVLLLFAYRPHWTQRLALIGLAGRMALTNYMVQVAVLDALASGYGFGLKVRPLLYLPCTLLLFGAEVVLSRYWLARHRFGPLEWLWRNATYWRWHPLRRAAPAPVVAAA